MRSKLVAFIRVFPPGDPVPLWAGRKAGQGVTPSLVNFCARQTPILIYEVRYLYAKNHPTAT